MSANMGRFLVMRHGNTLVAGVFRLIPSDIRKAQWEAAAVVL